jgi:ketosteroid isomerase-like protein
MDQAYVDRWYAAWNARDLDKILDFYAEDVEFCSPFITALGVAVDGVVHGKALLRAYFEIALQRVPNLHFEPIAHCVGARGHTMVYRNHQGVIVAETHQQDAAGRIARADAAYQMNV